MFYLGNVFVPRRRVLICWLPGLESHLAGFYPSDHSPHDDDHDDPMIIISSNLFVLPLWSSSAWRWSWGPCFWDDNCDDGCNITMITEMKTSWKRLSYVIFLLYLCRFVHLEGWILCFLLEDAIFQILPAWSEFISVSEDCQGLKQIEEKRKMEYVYAMKAILVNFQVLLVIILILTITSWYWMTPPAVGLQKGKSGWSIILISFQRKICCGKLKASFGGK